MFVLAPEGPGRGAQPSRPSWSPPHPPTYAYVLGLYLGDGNIARTSRRSQCIRIVLDGAYPEIVDECVQALARLIPVPVRVYTDRTPRRIVVQASSGVWITLFPQHGPGRKHERPIVLERWQQLIVDREPEAFLRGLIHSDGCRTVNRFQTLLPSGRVATYAYPRYFFSNLSADIGGLFCAAYDALGIRWTQSNHRNISVSHRDSVARLDLFRGPKT